VIVLVQEAENWAERRSRMISIGGPQKFNPEMDRAFNSVSENRESEDSFFRSDIIGTADLFWEPARAMILIYRKGSKGSFRKIRGTSLEKK
jgi:hypothetical protein